MWIINDMPTNYVNKIKKIVRFIDVHISATGNGDDKIVQEILKTSPIPDEINYASKAQELGAEKTDRINMLSSKLEKLVKGS